MVAQKRGDLPPGFRFHPTDEELIIYYLRNQSTSRPCPVSIIPEVDVYKFDPWELPERADFGENEWYFFTPRDRKYPNGIRPNRAAVSGYWKATGTDKAIYSCSKYVGVKKALVFYKGKPPKGIKTDWIMHEYRLNESPSQPPKQNRSMRLDDWVLCRIYKKMSVGNRAIEMAKGEMDTQSQSQTQTQTQIAPNCEVVNIARGPQGLILQRPCSLTHLWELEYYFGSISQNANFDDNNQNPCMSGGGNVTFAIGQTPQQYSQGSSISNQPIYVNHVAFQYQ
ncbi:unnamed protein product [Cuscuta epithymum]|uniref:NAC domain-containing protein n=1 Tax=Cuscuta epithymum TaxID=186058 RepID=A0AAV0EKL8_9ASTE|nr:unnamed protein product [Cuscuta epithymum]CAH9123942.1 unnamed protein product [Cuscuta epithymum]